MSNTAYTARTTVTRTQGGKALPTSYGEFLDPSRVQDVMDKLDEHDGALDRQEPIEVLDTTATSLSVKCRRTNLTVSGTMAFTLPDGTVTGQEKIVECISAANTPLATLTVTTPAGTEASTHVFTAAGQVARFVWNGTGWHMVDKKRAGAQAVTVGTTVLTGFDMCKTYKLSVTGTVHSTSSKGIPAGTVPGERIHVVCTTAASSPVGDIAITAATKTTAAAATSLANLTDTTMSLECEWDGAAWQAIEFTAGTGTATLS